MTTPSPFLVPDIAGHRYVVTGGSGGIGAATAGILRDSGAEVTTLDVLPAPDDQPHVVCDLSQPEAIEQAVATLEGDWHGLFNVAGIPGTQPADLVFAVNALAPRMLTELLLPRIVDGGSVVNVASIAGAAWPERLPLILDLLATEDFEAGAAWFARSAPDAPPYDFSKEVLTVYSMHASQRAWDRGVAVNAVNPGAVETRILDDFETSMGADRLAYAKTITGGRHGRPEDIAPAVAVLASPALGWINGASIAVDGGFLGAWMAGAIAPPPDAPVPTPA